MSRSTATPPARLELRVWKSRVPRCGIRMRFLASQLRRAHPSGVMSEDASRKWRSTRRPPASFRKHPTAEKRCTFIRKLRAAIGPRRYRGITVIRRNIFGISAVNDIEHSDYQMIGQRLGNQQTSLQASVLLAQTCKSAALTFLLFTPSAIKSAASVAKRGAFPQPSVQPCTRQVKALGTASGPAPEDAG